MSDHTTPEPWAAGAPTAAPGPPPIAGSAAPGPAASGFPTGPGRAGDPPSIDGPGVAASPTEAADAPAEPPPLKPARTRASATYIAVGVGLLILVLIIIFIAQNESKASVHFLGFHFRLALGLIILASTVAGGLVVLMVSLARVLQLRLMARRHRKAHDRP